MAAPTSDYGGSVVQIDYASKTLIVNGNSFIGTGYYDSQTMSGQNMTRLAKAGITWDMRYFLSNDPHATSMRQTDTWIQEYLDWAHSSGTTKGGNDSKSGLASPDFFLLARVGSFQVCFFQFIDLPQLSGISRN